MTTDVPVADHEPKGDLGVLFVHGIGAQVRGQTLAQFGAPVYQWIRDRFRGLDRRWRQAKVPPRWRDGVEEWANDGFRAPAVETPARNQLQDLSAQVGCDTIVGRASLTDARLVTPADPAAPAHATLVITRQRASGMVQEERWLLAESWWAATFSAPDFRDLGRWGIRIGPWTVGRHFGSRLRRRWLDRPRGDSGARHWLLTRGGLEWLSGVLGAIAALAAALCLSPLLVVGLTLLLVVGILPIPQLRAAILAVQLKAASTIGDSFVLVTKPVEAASIVGQVQRDLEWLSARCRAIVVVAHSQGGAVVHQALKEAIPEKLKLLVTFGSGLKKLEELKRVAALGGSYESSAVWTLVALIFFAVSVAWFVVGAGTIIRDPSRYLGQVGAVLLWGLVSAALLWAGLKDHVRGIELPDLRRWIARLASSGVDWTDCYASDDPVSNGILIDDQRVRDRSIEITNGRSMLGDHVAYWANRDQFLSLLVGRLMSPAVRMAAGLPESADLTTTAGDLETIGRDRRWRVQILGAIWWIAAVSVLLAVLREWPAWRYFLRYGFEQGVSTGAALIGMKPGAVVDVVVDWSAVGLLAAALGPYWIAASLWRSWNEGEMDAAVEGLVGPPPLLVCVAILLQVMVAGVGLYEWRGEPPIGSILIATFVVLFLTVIWPRARRESAAGGRGRVAPRPADEEQQPSMDRTQAWLLALWVPAAAGFGLGMAAWDGLAKLLGAVWSGGSLTAFVSGVPEEAFGALVGGAIVVVAVTRHVWPSREA